MDATTKFDFRLPVSMRADIRRTAEEQDRSDAYVVRKWIELGLEVRKVSQVMVQTTHRALTLQEIVDQLLACGYECTGGPLSMNVAFLDLVAKAHAESWQRRQRDMSPVERYARVSDVPTLPVEQHIIQRAALYLASCDGEANIQALALIRGAYGASLDEAREILHSMLVRTGFVAPDAAPRPERRGTPDVEV